MTFKCPQCGADLEVLNEAQEHLSCQFCGSSIYLNLDLPVVHYVLVPGLNERQAESALAKWLSDRELTIFPQIISRKMFYLPFWQVSLKDGRLINVPAVATEYLNLHEMQKPAGTMNFFDPREITAEVVVPEITLESVAGEEGLDNVAKAILYHAPFYEIKYVYNKSAFACLVDASGGAVIANDSPKSPKKEKDVFFGVLMFGSLALFFLEGLLLGKLRYAFLLGICTVAFIYFPISSAVKRHRV